MEVFSLEDDSCSQLFITQESKDKQDSKDIKTDEEDGQFLGLDPFDLQSPCSSIIDRKEKYQPACENISDDEMEFCDGFQG